jgi:CheY-like chemotaxis protein
VTEAANGKEALDHVRLSAPSLILLDLMMPEMDGFQFIAELRQGQPEHREIPIVVVTAKDLTAEDRHQLNGDVQRVIQKGGETYSRQEALLDEIRTMVGTYIKPG